MAKRLSNKRPKIARDSGRAKGLVKNTIGVLCIPIVITITRNFYFELTSVKALSEPARFFLLGFGAYVFMYIVLFKLEYFYVLGHEFVHTIFIWIFGGKIISVKVRKQSGSVTSTKKNIFIDLAPYLVPIYTLLVLGLYFAWSSFFEQVPPAKHFIFFVGFSFSFHDHRQGEDRTAGFS